MAGGYAAGRSLGQPLEVGSIAEGKFHEQINHYDMNRIRHFRKHINANLKWKDMSSKWRSL